MPCLKQNKDLMWTFNLLMGLKLKMFLEEIDTVFWIRNNRNGYSQNPVRNGTLYCAGGAESMSFIPMEVTSLLGLCAKAGNEDYYWGMGLTAEAVATV
jgi:hypothetical protein